MQDEDIMLQVSKGNIKMLAILFERHHVKLFNYFLRLSGDRGISEDLTQEVFLRILKYRNSYKNEGKFTSWMYQIGKNTHTDYWRKHHTEMSLDDKWEEEITTENHPEEITKIEQDNAFLQKALSNLTPAKKNILILSRFQGMKYLEISKILGCSLAAVKVQAHRAIKDLRKNYLQIKGGLK